MMGPTSQCDLSYQPVLGFNYLLWADISGIGANGSQQTKGEIGEDDDQGQDGDDGDAEGEDAAENGG